MSPAQMKIRPSTTNALKASSKAAMGRSRSSLYSLGIDPAVRAAFEAAVSRGFDTLVPNATVDQRQESLRSDRRM